MSDADVYEQERAKALDSLNTAVLRDSERELARAQVYATLAQAAATQNLANETRYASNQRKRLEMRRT